MSDICDSCIVPLDSTTADMKAMIRVGYYPNITDENMDHLLSLYPNDPAQGAPYNTGEQFQVTPQWKRAASFLGDAGVVSVRKLFTRMMAGFGSPVWSYCAPLSQCVIYTPALGSCLPLSQTTSATRSRDLDQYVSLMSIAHHNQRVRRLTFASDSRRRTREHVRARRHDRLPRQLREQLRSKR